MDSLKDILRRIEKIIDKKTGGKVKPFAEKAGIIGGTLTGYLNKERWPNVETLIKISNSYDVNLNWLLTGKGAERLNRERYMGKLEEWLDEMNERDPRMENYFQKRIEELFPEFKEWQLKQKS